MFNWFSWFKIFQLIITINIMILIVFCLFIILCKNLLTNGFVSPFMEIRCGVQSTLMSSSNDPDLWINRLQLRNWRWHCRQQSFFCHQWVLKPSLTLQLASRTSTLPVVKPFLWGHNMKVGWPAGASLLQKPPHEWTRELKPFTVNITNLTKVKKHPLTFSPWFIKFQPLRLVTEFRH